MSFPIIFLIIAPLAAVIALLLGPPFSRVAIALSLFFSACGLVLLYKSLILPLRKFAYNISQPEAGPITPVPKTCEIVNALQNHMNTREALLQHDLDEAREAVEKLRHEIQDLRAKRSIIVQAQQTTLEALRKSQSAMTAVAESMGAADCSDEDRVRNKQQLLGAVTALHRSECIMLRTGECLDSTDSASDKIKQTLPDAFPWKAEHATNIPVVDAQHKLLLSYLNKLHRVMQKGYNKKLLLEILDELTGYAFTHFATEEVFFTHTAYPHINKHMEEHHNFLETVAKLREDVLDDKAFIDIALLEYLKTWIVEHIELMDSEFIPYVQGTEPEQQQ